MLPPVRHLYYRRRTSPFVQPPPLPDSVHQFASACWDVRALQVLKVETAQLPSLLRYEDETSMAFSIEARLPFLDFRLVEKAITFAPQLK